MDDRLIAEEISGYFSGYEQVQAVALSGSRSATITDKRSDIDLYVFTTAAIPLEEREKIMQKRGVTRSNLNLQFWDVGDEWFDAPSGIEIDVMYWDVNWIRSMLDNVLVHQQASMGYTTCFWRTIQKAVPMFDRSGWFQALQESTMVPYPEGLRSEIINKNFSVLREVIPSYLSQIEKAIQRNDLVSVNHRLAAFLASYFDVLFATNRVLHPGEKRLLSFAKENCEVLPRDMEQQITAALQAAGDGSALSGVLNHLVDNMESILGLTESI
jgi:hypothetical protein